MYMYGRGASLFTWNYHNIVSHLYPNTKEKVQKNKNILFILFWLCLEKYVKS